jgi:hypothetical protein
MNRNIPIVFSISLLFLLVLGTGCVTQSSSGQTNQQNGWLDQIIAQADTPRISFEEAKAKLADYRIQGANASDESGNATIVYYMRSRDLDESGNATGWIFGVFNGHETEFLEYDRTGWTTITKAPIPSEEIGLNTIIPLNELFKKNREMIAGNPSQAIYERRDIELQQGIYKLTITSGSTSRILTFNATTGEMIV